MEYKNTIITPKTDFPMKAGLPAREPGTCADSLKLSLLTMPSCSLSAFFSLRLKNRTKKVTFERQSTNTKAAKTAAIRIKILNQSLSLSDLSFKLIPHSVNSFKVRGAEVP